MTAYAPLVPEHKVLLKRGEFIDAGRGGRSIPYKLYYPVDFSGRTPVIIWSHGYGGNRDGAGFISRFVAAHGYTVLHLTHPGSDSSLWEGRAGHPWDILRKTPITRAMTLERFQDIPFVLDQLPEWIRGNPDSGAAMDMSVLGMSGHSFGSMTTQAMAGQAFQDESGALRRYKDNRFLAGILYSPVPIRKLTGETPEKHLYGPIDIPLLHMTGTEDDSPLEGFTYDRRLAVYEHSAHPEKFLLVLHRGDHMVYNGTRGKLESNPLREKHEEIVRMLSLAYWDAYLKREPQAMDWLKGGGAQAWVREWGDWKFS